MSPDEDKTKSNSNISNLNFNIVLNVMHKASTSRKSFQNHNQLYRAMQADTATEYFKLT